MLRLRHIIHGNSAMTLLYTIVKRITQTTAYLVFCCVYLLPLQKERRMLFDPSPVYSFMFWHLLYTFSVLFSIFILLDETRGRMYYFSLRESSHPKLYPEERFHLYFTLLPFLYIAFTYSISDEWRIYYNNVQGIPTILGWAYGNPATIFPHLCRLWFHLYLSLINVFFMLFTFPLRRYALWVVEETNANEGNRMSC